MTESYLAELLKIQAKQIEARIAELQEDLARRIEEMRAEQERFAGAVLARLDSHEEYHRANEHRWGLVKLAGRHPFRLAALAAAGATALAAMGEGAAARGLAAIEKIAAWAGR